MDVPRLGSLTAVPAPEGLDLLAGPVARALAGWPYAGEVGVVEIDPDLADTAAMSEAYDVPLSASANCVVVSGRRGGEERVAACVVRADEPLQVVRIRRPRHVPHPATNDSARAAGSTPENVPTRGGRRAPP